MNSPSYDEATLVDGCAVPVVDSARVSDILGRMRPQDEFIDTADIFDLLSDPNRLRLLVAMLDRELCVCDLAAVCAMSESAASHALRLLRAHRVVTARRSGRRAFYRRPRRMSGCCSPSASPTPSTPTPYTRNGSSPMGSGHPDSPRHDPSHASSHSSGHSHGHAQSHSHGAAQGHAGARHRGRLAVAFVLIATFFVVELVAGLISGSLALVSDAGHNGLREFQRRFFDATIAWLQRCMSG